MSLDTSNKFFTLASDLVHYTSKNIFLTGKAGTGKTTFLKHIRNTCAKEMAIIAPTGVAAINAGGTTIHSFFQLPFSPFIPAGSTNSGIEVNNAHSLISRLKINSDKRKLLQALELLIIDEISMVRCDMMDAIDTVLRHFRGIPHLPFGGVQVLLIGDMHQLPPVIPDAEWSILSQFYKSPYFFSSNVITENEPLFISFEKIYRQSDESFIQLLNAVRNNELDESHARSLDALYKPDHVNDKSKPAIILTTHNANADAINNSALQELTTPRYTFKAVVEGEFYEKYFPAEELLVLKVGAQVMFIKNDTEKIRRYFNGKIGTVFSIDQDSIIINCPEDGNTIEVQKEKWENIRYQLNLTSKQIEEEVIGSFTQYPLRLAWAITIHKSQGLTFEQAIIDAGAAFSPGQVYVALSRCTGIEGLVLKSKINYRSLKTDQRILEFSRNLSSVHQLESQLQGAKKEFQQSLLVELFNFSNCYKLSADLNTFITTEYSSFNSDLPSWMDKVITEIRSFQDISYKFVSQLHGFFITNTIPQENDELQQRVMAACKYYHTKIQALLQHVATCKAVTDSKQTARSFNELLYELFTSLHEKKFYFESCSNGFDGYGWHVKKKNFRIPSFKINAYAAGNNQIVESLAHPALYQKLKALRDSICNKSNKPVYLVAASQALADMSNYLPQNLHELGKISGFGKIRLKEYGEQFLDIIISYCDAHQLSSKMLEVPLKKERKEKKEKSEKQDTKAESFKLYQSGKTIAEIALSRNLSATTIESHLAYYISIGKLNIQELLSKEKLQVIEPVLIENNTSTLSSLKEQLGDQVTFGDIRMALAWKTFQSREETS